MTTLVRLFVPRTALAQAMLEACSGSGEWRVALVIAVAAFRERLQMCLR